MSGEYSAALRLLVLANQVYHQSIPWTIAQADEAERLVREIAAASIVAWNKPRHWSSCAVHNEPAYPAGPCDCGGGAPAGVQDNTPRDS